MTEANASFPFGTKDYELKELELINSSGMSHGLQKIMIEMQIFQSIFDSVMTGHIVINDGNDVFSTFKLCGNEYIKMVIDKPGLNLPFKRIFRITQATTRTPVNDSSQIYILHFCSDELVSSKSLIVSKAYKSTKVRNIIYDILTNELNVDEKRIFDLENTSGVFDIIIPGQTPFEAIQWITARAYDQKKFCYFFFENKNGFNLTSLQSLIKQPVFKTLKYEIKNSAIDGNLAADPSDNKDSIDNLRIMNDFDVITSMTNGAFASRLLSIDIFHQTYENIDYSLEVAEAQGNLINKFKPFNDLKNSKNESPFQAFGAFFRTNLAINDTASEKSNDIRYWLQPRALHLALLHNFQIEIDIPGDIELKAGDIVEYDFPLFTSAGQDGKKM
ncbi:MAG: hypothetical protein ACO3XH_05485, partial [Candidatus Nanopelagicales bacterium]